MLKTASTSHVDSDPHYADFERIIARRIADANGPLFTTDAKDLWQAYLAGIPVEQRQHYTCHCCRRFVEKYGGLVVIADDGSLQSLLWYDDFPSFFNECAADLRAAIRKAKVTGVFINDEKTWGQPRTGEWTHIHGSPKEIYSSRTKTASQLSAEKLQDFIMLKRGLAEFSLEAVVQAVRVLEADAVDRSEKTLSVAKWLLDLHQKIADLRGPIRDNLVWLAVAKAPPGWCHVRSTMIATLLEDIVAGLPFDSIKSRWDAKMHPLQYQRPTTIKQGSIDQANKIVAKLGSEGALQRRFARLDDITALWTPMSSLAADKPKSGGAFDHLKAKSTVKPVELPPMKISWSKFRDTVLPNVRKIEVLISSSNQPFFGMVTAANPDAPPILQWDGLEGRARNPVSWYFYHNGSSPSTWNLSPGMVTVNAICSKPCYWQQPDKFTHQGDGVFFVLDGARDMRHTSGAGFFPECLRSEYHEIRHAMEAYARSATIAGRDEGTANGIALGKESSLTVKADGQSYVVTME